MRASIKSSTIVLTLELTRDEVRLLERLAGGISGQELAQHLHEPGKGNAYQDLLSELKTVLRTALGDED